MILILMSKIDIDILTIIIESVILSVLQITVNL